MMPFHNILDEWYAAQTSKQIRAVRAMSQLRQLQIGPRRMCHSFHPSGKDQAVQACKAKIAAGGHRLDGIDRLIAKPYEDSFCGKLSDECCSKMAVKGL